MTPSAHASTPMHACTHATHINIHSHVNIHAHMYMHTQRVHIFCKNRTVPFTFSSDQFLRIGTRRRAPSTWSIEGRVLCVQSAPASDAHPASGSHNEQHSPACLYEGCRYCHSVGAQESNCWMKGVQIPHLHRCCQFAFSRAFGCSNFSRAACL